MEACTAFLTTGNCSPKLTLTKQHIRDTSGSNRNVAGLSRRLGCDAGLFGRVFSFSRFKGSWNVLDSLTLELEGSKILCNFRELLRRRKVPSKCQELLSW
jgi:hypothetical protein